MQFVLEAPRLNGRAQLSHSSGFYHLSPFEIASSSTFREASLKIILFLMYLGRRRLRGVHGHGFDHLRLNPDWSNQADADQADQRAARTDTLLHYSFKDAFVQKFCSLTYFGC